MVIVGEKEAADGTVAVRPQGGGEQTVMTIQQFVDHINAEVAEMTKDFWSFPSLESPKRAAQVGAAFLFFVFSNAEDW